MPSPSEPLPADVADAIQRGDIIEGIALLREATGLSLKGAKAVVDRHIRGDSVAAPPRPIVLTKASRAALQRGDKTAAVRLLRQETGLGLKEAKEAVESHQREAAALPGQQSPGEVPTSNGRVWLLTAVVITVVLGYYLVGRH